MAEIRINATGGLKLYDADDSHYAQILAGTISSNVDALTLGSSSATFGIPVTVGEDDTGHDVKLFGASAGAYMEWDESVNLLDLRGATAAGPGNLKLTTGELTVVDADVLGKIEFQAPLEASGTDSILVGAAIWAEADDTFSSSVNNTDLVFALGKSEAAAEKFRFTADGEIGLGGANYGTDGQVLTSAGANSAAAWEDAGGGDLNFGGDTFGADKVIGSNDDYDMTFETNNTARLNLANGGEIHTGAETSGGTELSAGGLCVDTNALDNGCFVWKNSDVAHGFTGLFEADTVAQMRKNDGAGGGLKITGIKDTGQVGVAIECFNDGGGDTTLTTSASGAVKISAAERSGTGGTTLSTTSPILIVNDFNYTRFLVRNDGNLYYDGTTNASHWDEHEDANMVRSLDLSLAEQNNIDTIDSKFDKFVKYNHEKLAEVGLVGRERDGTPNSFICITKLQRLHNGAIWQQHEKHQQLLEAVYDLAKKAVGEDEADAILERHEVKLLH
jgi:hypothetical protein